MLKLLTRFWIEFPLTYAVTVGGLTTGYRRGGVPQNACLTRALLAGLPVMLVVAVLWSSIAGLAEIGIRPPALPALYLLLGLPFYLSASALIGALLAQGKLASALRRGTALLDGAEDEFSPNDSNILTLAGRPIPPMDETKHFKILGTTGTGKSTAIRELLTKALARGDRAVIADPDGGYLERYYDADRGDVILSPFDPRAARWDLFGEIVLPQDADHLARSCIVDAGGKDPIWTGFARTYVECILRQLHNSGEQDLGRLYYALAVAKEAELRGLLQATPASRFLGDQEGGKFLQSVQSVATHHFRPIEYIARQAEATPLSVRRWIREGRGVLFLPYHANEIASLSSLISAWMRLAIFEILSGPEGGQRVMFVIDELDALGPIDGLKDALTRLRKFNGAYGQAQSQSIVENAGNTVILRCSASERGGTAEFASPLIGKREVVRKQHSVSRARFSLFRRTHTVSDQVVTEDAVMASEIEQLPDLSGFLKLASKPHWQRVRFTPDAK